MERLVSLDQRLSLWVNQNGPSFLDPFWSFFSETVVWFPLYVLVVAFIFWRLGWKKGLVVLLTLILTVVVTDQLSVLVKNTAMRLRPCHDPWMTAQGVRCPDGRRLSGRPCQQCLRFCRRLLGCSAVECAPQGPLQPLWLPNHALGGTGFP